MTEPTPTPSVVVIGSLNVDTLLNVPWFPEVGATVAATGFERRYGGKGANQALAAARQGATASLIGCVGDDGKGPAYMDYLESSGLNIQGVNNLADVETGAAYITVSPDGTNTIVCVQGANAWLSAELVAEQTHLLEAADVVICQFESPIESVVMALQYASENGKTSILNPSPLSTEFPWGQVAIDFLILNERESAALFGYFVEDTHDAPQLRAQMADLGVSTLIITRGADPTLVFSAHQAFKVPPPAVDVVDTTGAGDTFTGAFAVHWAQTHNLLSSIRKANIAGALATARLGAQEAMPMRDEVDAFGKPPAPEHQPESEPSYEEPEYSTSEEEE